MGGWGRCTPGHVRGSRLHAGGSCPLVLTPYHLPRSPAQIGVASTKAYTSQIVALTMLGLVLGEDSLRSAGLRHSIIEALEALPKTVAAALKLDDQMRVLAKHLSNANSLMFFARGYNYATALEAALKVIVLELRAPALQQPWHGAAGWWREPCRHVLVRTHAFAYPHTCCSYPAAQPQCLISRAQVKEVALIHSEGINAGEMKVRPWAGAWAAVRVTAELQRPHCHVAACLA